MEGNSLVIPLSFLEMGNYPPTSAIECKVITRVLMGND